MQPRWLSLLEAVTNTCIGYVLSVGLQLVLHSLLGLQIMLSDALIISAAFTVLSVLRGYTVRRLFNQLRGATRANTKTD